SETFPTSGMTLSGQLCPLAPLERPTDEIESSSLLPTPTCQDRKNNGGPAQMRRNTLPLNAVVALLPTPSYSDGAGGGPNDPKHRMAAGHQVQLIDLGMHPGDTELWGRF